MGDFEIIIDPFAIFAFLNFIFFSIIMLYENKSKDFYGNLVTRLCSYVFMLCVFIYCVLIVYVTIYSNNTLAIDNSIFNNLNSYAIINATLLTLCVCLIASIFAKGLTSFNDVSFFGFVLFVFPIVAHRIEDRIVNPLLPIVFFIFSIIWFFKNRTIGIILFCAFFFIIFIVVAFFATILYSEYLLFPLYLILFFINFSIQTMKFIIFLEEKDLRD